MNQGILHELFVRNRAFSGPVSQQGLTQFVGAIEFAKALGIQFGYNGSSLNLGPTASGSPSTKEPVFVVKANGKSIPFINENGRVLIALKPAAEALAAPLEVNPQLGTIDVRAPRKASTRRPVPRDGIASTKTTKAPQVVNVSLLTCSVTKQLHDCVRLSHKYRKGN